MQKLLLLAAMLAMALVISLPLWAQDIDTTTVTVPLQSPQGVVLSPDSTAEDICSALATNPSLLNNIDADANPALADVANSCNDLVGSNNSATDDDTQTQEQDQDQETESGDQTNESATTVDGDGNQVCTANPQDGSTGNFVNGQQDQQLHAGQDDFEPGGLNTEERPETATDCAPTSQNSSAAG
jgi:hypothetical protein